MHTDWFTISGIVQPGHRVASGSGLDRRYPQGTILMQKPFFKALGLDLNGLHEGTLNIEITTGSLKFKKPAYFFPGVEWTELHPPEDFSFYHCRLHQEQGYAEGWIYQPSPQTKHAHFQPSSVLEIIAPLVPCLTYGNSIKIDLRASEIDFSC